MLIQMSKKNPLDSIRMSGDYSPVYVKSVKPSNKISINFKIKI